MKDCPIRIIAKSMVDLPLVTAKSEAENVYPICDSPLNNQI
jgi:hypothetical protein